jgi:phosphoribosylaminoimidazole-succinocarboxamide synthase
MAIHDASDIRDIVGMTPVRVGRSKVIYGLADGVCLVKLIPSLTSFTFSRHEHIPGTEVLRLDFFEQAAQRLKAAGIPVAFRERVSADSYLADFCTEYPFEIIVKNVAVGSTLRKYPGLFANGYVFNKPVVKFDYRIDPEDIPIAEDYVREAGCNPDQMRRLALDVNDVLCQWLSAYSLLDFCLIFGGRDDRLMVTGEISPDSMRVRSRDGRSLDKDLFRNNVAADDLIAAWSYFIDSIR